jgi:C4-dicarboxylate transporter DctM subunit
MVLFFLLLIGSFAVGMPIGFSMLFSSSFFIFFQKYNMTIIPQYMQGGVDSFPLLAVPGFLLVGDLMGRCGLTEKLTRLAMNMVGFIKGGLAHVAIMAGMFMAGISGSAVADTAALGSVLVPFMKKDRYSSEFAAMVVAIAGTMGPIIPPSIGMVVLGSMANISIGRLFLGGAVPGVLMGLYSMVVIYFIAKKRNYGRIEMKFSIKELLKAFLDAAFALFIPVLIVGGILLGVFTPTEASIVAVLFVAIIGMFVYRTLRISDIIKSLRDTVYSVGAVFFILAAASVFGWVLAIEQFDVLFGNLLKSITSNPTVILFLISAFILILGCFIETLSLLILLTPFIYPIVKSFGIDPIQFGIAFMLGLVIGLVTPPVGLCMYVACSISKVTIEGFSKELPLFFIALVVVLVMVILFPSVSTWLPNLLMPVKG